MTWSSSVGIVVNAELEALADIFVVGSTTSYCDEFVGPRRVDRYDQAVKGLLAGHNRVVPARKKKVHRHQPVFRSNLLGIGVTVDGVGLDASLQAMEYVKATNIVGMVLWNAPNILEKA
ncbi:hypothetical protein H257_08559 [Aphanomyces astaci]|uniref:Uncharacterized protein n=1 Tax=Aphanomyces astaci TaxID=112090 RepID=W4GF39_APHAT|nr:hypothetical protein H257_08559 [Aphanomyces astaci]ETV77669.1 hypothetical protein H257_08559 [Aphanomyces astaci]|eukprot:XP_009832779.1 hypothetical protein H257_08559 [Aphanomyces astaci]